MPKSRPSIRAQVGRSSEFADRGGGLKKPKILILNGGLEAPRGAMYK